MAEIFMQHSNFQVGNTGSCPYITFWLQYTYLKGLYKNFYTFPNQFFRGSTPKLFSQRKGVNGSILTYYQMKKLIETAAGHWYMSLVSVMQQKMYLEFFRYFSGINVGLA